MSNGWRTSALALLVAAAFVAGWALVSTRPNCPPTASQNPVPPENTAGPEIAVGLASAQGLISRLDSSHSDDDVNAAISGLARLGTDAFPALISAMNNSQLASPVFTRNRSVNPGFTVGDACFYILVTQIEGTRKKPYVHSYVLSPDSVAAWLAARPNATLAQLRVAAAEESLAKLRSLEQAGHPTDPELLALVREWRDRAREPNG